MQHAPLTPLTYPGCCKKLLFRISVFGGKISLIFLIIDISVDLRSNLHIGLSDLVNPLIFVDSCPAWHNYPLWGLLFQFHSWLCFFWHLQHWNYIQIVASMSILVNHLTVEQAHKEFNSLADKITAKYEQLDNGKLGIVGTPGFNAKSAKLACFFAHMSQLCYRLNLPMPTQLHRLPFLKYWRALFGSRLCRQAVLLYGGCSFVPIDL